MRDFNNLRRLTEGHAGPLAAGPSRVKSIIRENRPSYPIVDGHLRDFGGNDLPDTFQGPPDFVGARFDMAKNIAKKHAGGVGCIQVKLGGGWLSVGTAFRVPGGERRMATAAHLLAAMIKPGVNIREITPYNRFDFGDEGNLRFEELDEGRRDVRVAFADQPPTAPAEPEDASNVFQIETIVRIHPFWDLMLFDLATPADRAIPPDSLPIANGPFEGGDDLLPACLISYPITARDEVDQERLEQVIGDELGVRRCSLGFLTLSGEAIEKQVVHEVIKPGPPIAGEAFVALHDTHDATTLPGSSGAPIFNLVTGKVIGLHFSGRHLEEIIDARFGVEGRNYVINLPLAFEESRLQRDMANNGVPGSEWDWGLIRRDKSPGVTDSQLDSLESVTVAATSLFFDSVFQDRPDFRDLVYRAPLIEARDELMPQEDSMVPIANQRNEPACVAFALAMAINMQLSRLHRQGPVSERMLYEMALLHDEWIEDSNGGTSLRGAIKGFFHAGVHRKCLADPQRPCPANPRKLCLGNPKKRCLKGSDRPGRAWRRTWSLSIEAAKEARSITLGAYYRLGRSIIDFQLAVNEVGAVLVSAQVHSGWLKPTKEGKIRHHQKKIGAHAFVIVGYDRDGFIVANSWGEDWSAFKGQLGFAHWSYRDWGENLIDAWVMRLAPSAPSAFDITPSLVNQNQRESGDKTASPLAASLPLPRRFALIGHVVQAERDGIVEGGRTGMGLSSIRETALYLNSEPGRKKYWHVLLICHDPFLGRDTIARLAGHMIEPFKKNKIYPIHVIYGLDEIKTIALRLRQESIALQERLVGFGFADRRLSRNSRPARLQSDCRPIRGRG